MKTILAAAVFLAWSLAASAVNLVSNSSFETGTGRGWQFWSASDNAGSPLLFKNYITNSGAFHGSKCAVLPAYNLHSRPMFLQAGQPYAFTFYVKAINPNSLRYEVASINNVGAGTGGLMLPTTSWTRYTNIFTPSSNYWYEVGWSHVQTLMTAFIDGVQVEASATPTAYAPSSTLEAGLESTSPAAAYNTYYSTNAKTVAVNWWNDGAATTNAIQYEVFDLWNKLQASGYLTNTLAPGFTTNTIPLPVMGWNRIVTRIVNVLDSRDELTVAVLPLPAFTGANTNGVFGTHPNYDATQISYLRSSGATWGRSLSPANRLFRWSTVEPAQDTWVFQDAGVATFATNGLSALGTLTDTDGSFPAWAVQPGGGILIADWTNYVATLVNRFKTNVHYWEMWNEPYQSGPAWIRIATNYAAMLAAGAATIKAEDPTAYVVGFGGVVDIAWASNVWNLLTAPQKATVDFLSTHLYPNDNSTDPNVSEFDNRPYLWKTAFGAIRPIWNTETGIWNRGGMLTEDVIWNYSTQGTYAAEWMRAEAMIRSRVSVERITRNMLRSLGNSFAKYFYYDDRSWNSDMMTATHPTTWDYNQSPRPPGVAMSIASSFLDQYTAAARITNSGAAALEMYFFQVGISNVLAAFSYDRTNRQLTVTNTSFTVYDVMGNVVTQPAGKVNINRTPQYILTTTLTAAQLQQTFTNATIAILADTTPPNISIDIAPTATWPGGTGLIKWTGIDDTYVNSTAYPTNVLFSWKLDANCYSSYTAFVQTNFLWLSMGAGNHTFYLKARDRAGNVATTNYVFQP